ncbi:MAG: hypothetical protein VCA36_01475, partial [Opitutales bacterium]
LARANWAPVREEERKKALLQIERHPLSTDAGRLAALSARLGEDRVEPELIKKLMQRHQRRPELLGPWLAGRNLHDKALSLFSMELLRTRPELFGPWFSILLHPAPARRMERLQVAGQLVVDAKGLIAEARRDLYGAALLRVHGKQEESRLMFEQALVEEGALPMDERNGFLDALAREALAAGELDFALKALRKRFAEGISEEDPYPACERYFFAAILNKETEEALAIAEQIEKRFPAEIAAQNNLAYLNLLLERNVEETAKGVEELAGNGPPFAGLITTLALARLRIGKAKEAMDAITPGGTQIIFHTDADKAVCVAVLRANGKSKLAGEMEKSIMQQRLLLEEAALLNLAVDGQP